MLNSLSTRVLIIGSGGAGLRCAIALAEAGIKDILIVGDRPLTDPHTVEARGGVNAALATMDSKDSPLIHAVDTMREGALLSNPALVETLTREAPQAIQDLIDWGAQFHKEPDGRLTQRFFGAHSYRRTVFSGDQTGKEIIRVLAKKVQEHNVPFLEHVYISDLIVEDGTVHGAVGVNSKGSLVSIAASQIVLATGGYANLFRRSSSRPGESYGDGLGLALRAGASIGDMEMVQFHPTGLVWPDKHAGMLVTEAMRAEGAHLLNGQKERFMRRYDPKRMELSTRDIVARANYLEIQAGQGSPRGGVYLDISHRPLRYLKDRLPKMLEIAKKYNRIDLSKEPLEVAPTAHYSMGGIYFKPRDYSTGVKGLYAIGECTMGVHGANRLGGNSLAEILVFGKLVGEYLSGKEGSVPKKLRTSVEHQKHQGYLNAEDILDDLRLLLWNNVGIVREAAALANAQRRIQTLWYQVHELGLKSDKDKASHIKNSTRLTTALLIAEAITTGALLREESRGAHARSDFKETDREWQKNILFSLDQGVLVQSETKIPQPSVALQKALKKVSATQTYGHLE